MNAGADAAATFAARSFRYPWRTYQQLALARIAQLAEDPETRGEVARRHPVAPPGSGKTILGLELARQRARPALVLSPTTTFAAQWRSQLALFLDDGCARDASSADPEQPGAITSLTYPAAWGCSMPPTTRCGPAPSRRGSTSSSRAVTSPTSRLPACGSSGWPVTTPPTTAGSWPATCAPNAGG